MSEQHDIFISYRRDGGFEVARHLFDLLHREGFSVTFDMDSLRSGRFDSALFKRIDECIDFILILSKGCFERTLDPKVLRENDWVRRELAYALEKEKNIVPIFLSGFENFPSTLPDDIRRVTLMHGPLYVHEYFDEFYERLKSRFLRSRPHEMKHERDTVDNVGLRDSLVRSFIFADSNKSRAAILSAMVASDLISDEQVELVTKMRVHDSPRIKEEAWSIYVESKEIWLAVGHMINHQPCVAEDTAREFYIEEDPLVVRRGIDPEKCVSCGACKEVCPADAILDGVPYKINRGKCVECGVCVDACPAEAIAL